MTANTTTTLTAEQAAAEIRKIAASALPATSTNRSVSADDAEALIAAMPHAKRRARVYSWRGFVPSSYRYRCPIQWIEAVRSGEGWIVNTNWSDAKRSGGRGEVLVVQ